MPRPSLFFSTYQAYGFGAGNYWSTMIADICGALGRAGAACDLVEAANAQSFQAFLGAAIPEPRSFIASFNFIVPFPDIKVGGKFIFVQELFPVRAVTIFLDHPVHLAATIHRFEWSARTHAYRPAPAPPPVYGVMEPGHAALLLDLGIAPERIFPFPQAGPEPAGAVTPLAHRSIDTLFHGTIADLPPIDAFLDEQKIVDRDLRDAFHTVLESALAGSEDVYAGSKRRLMALGQTANPLNIAEFARLVDVRARAVRRWTMLSALSDLEIVFCGAVAESFRRANPKGDFRGPKSFAEVSDLVRRSKIVLNDSLNLRHGALMRFHYAMAEGCILATESGDWYRTEFAEGEAAVLLPADQSSSERLREVLADGDRAQRIADAGRARQAAAHRWDHRVGPMLRAVASP